MIHGQPSGNPLGTCQKCHVLACAGHAARDPNYPRWICVVCDVSLLARSAVATAGAASLLIQLFSSALLAEEAVYPTLEAFLEARPDFRWVLDYVGQIHIEADQRFQTGGTARLWTTLTPEGRRMIAAAIAIARRLEIDPRELAEGLRVFVERLNRGR